MIEYGLVKSLERLRSQEDRAALAKLRRGLGKKMGTADMYPYVVPHLPDAPNEHEMYFLVASLFAFHPAPAPRGTTMGKVFRDLHEGRISVETRFLNLLAADSDDLGGYLRQAISLARSRKVPVDYHQLLHDIRWWNDQNRRVQLRWAKDFWGYEKETETDIANGMKGEEQ